MTFNNVLFIFFVNLAFVPLPYARTCENFSIELPYYTNVGIAQCLELCDDYEFAALRVIFLIIIIISIITVIIII